MRKIILDTETTGLEPKQGHRIIEIGCIELINRRKTERNFHQYLNPERDIEDGAFNIHGLSNEFLSDKSRFADIAQEFIDFIKDGELIIHNAPFDVGFINAELKLLGKKWGKIEDYCTVFDTLLLAREKHPGQKNNLDALCKRYEVDNSQRDLHGALLDAQILLDCSNLNPYANYLLSSLGFEEISKTFRMYKGIQPPCSMNQVYGLACLELG